MSIPVNLYSIGAKGVFCFKDPYDTFFKDRNDVLTIGSLITLGEIYSENKDPYALYYANMGVSETDFKKSLANNDIIIGFRNSMDTWYYVPSSYVTSLPNVNGVSYTVMGISITLGPLRTDYDLTDIISLLKNDILSTMGINAAIQPSVLSSERVLSNDQAQDIEIARNKLKQNIASDYDLASMLVAAKNKISILENYILCNGCDGNGSINNLTTGLDCNGNPINNNLNRALNTNIPEIQDDCDTNCGDADSKYVSNQDKPVLED